VAARAGRPDAGPARGARIVLALSSALAVTGADGAAARQLKEAVERVPATLGLPAVPATMRVDAELAPGAYVVEVRQSEVARGRVRPGGRFQLGAAPPGADAWPARDAATGRAGAWLPASGAGPGPAGPT